MSVKTERETEREKWGREDFKVQISHVSDSSTELHEENVFLALIVCLCLLRYPNMSLKCVSLNVSLYMSVGF